MARLKTMHKRRKRTFNRTAHKKAIARAAVYGFAVRAGAFLFERYVRPAFEAELAAKREKQLAEARTE